jgi:hypothetical protein
VELECHHEEREADYPASAFPPFNSVNGTLILSHSTQPMSTCRVQYQSQDFHINLQEAAQNPPPTRSNITGLAYLLYHTPICR